MSTIRVVNVGIVGCGDVAQVIHIPTLNYMYQSFRITYLCGKSADALEFCSKRVVNHVPKTTSDVAVVCASLEVDVVFVLNSDEYHTRDTILALKNDKHVFVEKPMAMTELDALAIIEAEKRSKGRVFVGFMRRYATAFTDAVKEVGGLEKILYARVRDIIGPNPVFIGQSGTFPEQFSDYTVKDTEERKALADQIAVQGMIYDCKVELTPETTTQYRGALGGLSCHDISAMREALGMPKGVVGASFNLPFWTVLFKYPGFTVSYEAGYYDVPIFDAHIEIYGASKSVRVQYDSPYVKGLPVTMHIRESLEGAYRETMIRRTYEDTFTLEMKELYAMIVENKTIKTTAEDSLQDLYVYQMIMRAAAMEV